MQPTAPFEQWLKPDAAGLCCAPGGFHIDPTRAVPRAIITHGHSDHARPGHGAVLATPETIAIVRTRLGPDVAGSFQELRYGEPLSIGGVRVPRGSVVNLVPYVTQRDPRWFEQPELFLPARFERESQLPRGVYLPFGLGRRLCVGRSFAQLESLTVLALLLQSFQLRPAPSQPEIELEAQISLHPRGGLRLSATPL